MIQKSIKIAIRRLITLKAFSLINIGGMSIAISVVLAILLYTSYHFSFDKYIPNGENKIKVNDAIFANNSFFNFFAVKMLRGVSVQTNSDTF